LGLRQCLPFDTRSEKILFTLKVGVENPNQIWVDITLELDENLQTLERKELGKGKTMSAEERKFDVLMVDDFAIAKGAVEICLGFGVTDPTINVEISMLGCHPLNALARGGRRCHDGWVMGAKRGIEQRWKGKGENLGF